MGVDIADIVTAQPKRLEDFQGKSLAIDGNNALYQFLSIIRQPDGTPLMDRRGRITSHLSGLLYRTANMLQVGIKPLYAFDGEPHPLKRRVLEGRTALRQRAEVEWQEALEAGDMERARTKAQQAARLTREMVEQSKHLVELMGLPCIQASSDGEAQASFMAKRGDVWAASSQDYDSLLYGSPRLVRNLAISGRRKLPRRQTYVDVEPEFVELGTVLSSLGIDHEQLVDMGILIGTDFNEGIKGIGPKKALSLIKENKGILKAMEAQGAYIENFEEIREIFLKPQVTERYELGWREPQDEAIKDFLCGGFDFSEERIGGALSKMREAMEAKRQRSLDQWF